MNRRIGATRAIVKCAVDNVRDTPDCHLSNHTVGDTGMEWPSTVNTTGPPACSQYIPSAYSEDYSERRGEGRRDCS